MRRQLDPSREDVARMLTDLARVTGSLTRAALVLGTTYDQVRLWRNGRNPSGPSRRAIWLLWSLLCRPGRKLTVADLLTWGRVSEAKERKASVCRHPGWDWEI